jgi:hypothetical protein
MTIRLLALSAALLAGTMAAAQPAPRAFTIAETGAGFDRLDAAIAAVGDGRGTILVAPGRYRQCAVQAAGDLVLRAREPGTAIFEGVACEGKAALVLRGRSATVEGLVFQAIAVPDGNGAGIRLERGDLTVRASLFRASQQGILTANDPAGAILVDRSTFSRLGRCDEGTDCAHSLYVGHYGRLTVTASRFEAGTGGHYLKSRARRVAISGNSFDDSAGRLTNYMIDLSNGAVGTISGNVMVQGRDKDNWSLFIALAPEGAENPSDGLVIRDNRAGFVPGLARGSAFLADWTGARVTLAGNVIAPSMTLVERR